MEKRENWRLRWKLVCGRPREKLARGNVTHHHLHCRCDRYWQQNMLKLILIQMCECSLSLLQCAIEVKHQHIFFCCSLAPTPCPPPPSRPPRALSLPQLSSVSCLVAPAHTWTSTLWTTSLLSGRLLFPPPRLLLSHAFHHLEGMVVPPTDNWMLLQEQIVFLSSVYFLICCPSEGSFRNFLDWPLEVWDLTSDLFLQVFQDKKEAYSHEGIWLNFWSENLFETSCSHLNQNQFYDKLFCFVFFFNWHDIFLIFLNLFLFLDNFLPHYLFIYLI